MYIYAHMFNSIENVAERQFIPETNEVVRVDRKFPRKCVEDLRVDPHSADVFAAEVLRGFGISMRSPEQVHVHDAARPPACLPARPPAGATAINIC